MSQPGAGAARIVVVGSINMDLVAKVERLPRPGETVHGEELIQSPGGKGANQAVGVARLGGSCVMIGRVGSDALGGQLREGLARAGVDVEHVLTTPECSSGLALIGVESSGQNAITIIAGANGRLCVPDIEARRDLIAGARSLVVQLEVPLETVEAAVRLAKESGVRTILDPAPAPRGALPKACLEVDVISPNQSEAEALTGVVVDGPGGAEEAARRLLEMGAGQVVLKLGEQGAYWRERSGSCGHVRAAKVQAVDTTAAGDAFTAGLAVGLSEGMGLEQAVRLGCAAGTLATMKTGAQQAMPGRDEAERFLQESMR